MTTAALALGLAVLVAPHSSRRRLHTLRPVARNRRKVPTVLIAAVGALFLALAVPVTVTVAVGVAAGTVALRRRRGVRQRRRAEEAVALRGALEISVGELRVGAHPVTAFGVAADETGGVVAASLREVAARARLGADVAAGLRGVAAYSALPAHWERLAVCWELAHSHGLGVATLMRTAQCDLVERERFSSRVNAGMAGARTTAAVLAGLPVLGVGLGQLLGAAPLAFLLSGGAGGALLVVGVSLACAGLLWSDRITTDVTT